MRYIVHVRIKTSTQCGNRILKIEGVEKVDICNYHYHVNIGKLYDSKDELRDKIFAQIHDILRKHHTEVVIESKLSNINIDDDEDDED